MRLLFQRRCRAFAFLFFVCALMLQLGCKQKSHGSPEGYDLRTPQKRNLGKVLNEISGINVDPRSKALLAIADSKRKIFSIDLTSLKLSDYAEKFAEQGDFEDLVILGDTVYVLISDGTILAVPRNSKNDSTTRAYPFWSEEKNDFETLYYDPTAKGLVMLCKSCAEDKGTGTRSAYRFDLARKYFDSAALYTISTDHVKKAVLKSDATFKPSAAAIHPIDKKLYILSSAGQLLVITDTRGKVLEAFNLNPDRNPQAEGITFAQNGTMFISNEGKYGKATLHIYQYKTKSLSGTDPN